MAYCSKDRLKARWRMPNPRMANNQHQALKKENSVYVQPVSQLGNVSRDAQYKRYIYRLD